ncbi:MAG: DNA polymerase I [candidate division WOR-3 bacterium]|nr:DNA polymerase I [candidate division WOR-3 bacterium]
MSNLKGKFVVLIDGHSLVYRSYYAFIRNPLRTSKGQNTSAVFGFVNSLKKLLNNFSPQYLAVAFEAGRETFRHRLYQDYKAERPETPNDLASQLPIIEEIISAYGIKVLKKEGYEADDILATLAQRLSRKGIKVYIVTSDKDLFQLVNDNIFIYDVYNDIIYDRKKTQEKFGINDPSQIRDVLALAGDSIDNIPGVPNIGIKRAVDIIQKYNSLESALENDERLKPYKDIAQLSKVLATVKTDVKIKVSLNHLKLKKPNIPRLIQIFQELEFSSLLKDIVKNDTRGTTQPQLFAEKTSPELMPDDIQPQQFAGKPSILKFASQEAENQFGFYYSNNGLFVSNGKETIRITDTTESNNFLNSSYLKITYDLKSQMHCLRAKQLDLTEPYFDVKIASYLLDSNRKRYELSDLVLWHLQQIPSSISDSERAYFAFHLYQKLSPEIFARGLATVLEELEMPLIKVLVDMEQRGVKIDPKLLEKISSEIEDERELLKQEIFRKAGVKFNINSPQQLSKVLFEKLSLPKTKRTKTGFSTDSSVLLELAPKAPIVQDILRYREITKLQTTYLAPMRKLMKTETNRIHCQFNQTGTSTGRLSASNPNLQNIPIRSDLGKKIRQGFIAERNYCLISADYSQIELRILAELSGDEKLIEAFLLNEDIHTRTAAEVFNKSQDKITENERRIAKMVNYGLIYGISDLGLSVGLGITQDEARNIIDNFLAVHYKVAEWQEKTIAEVKETGYAKTIFGRLRPIPGIFAQNRILYESALRAAINHPIQGSAADIIKKAMIEIYQQMKKEKFLGGIILQVHDELLLEVEKNRIEEAQDLVKQIMQKKYLSEVPLVVRLGVGENWAIAHDEQK